MTDTILLRRNNQTQAFCSGLRCCCSFRGHATSWPGDGLIPQAPRLLKPLPNEGQRLWDGHIQFAVFLQSLHFPEIYSMFVLLSRWCNCVDNQLHFCTFHFTCFYFTFSSSYLGGRLRISLPTIADVINAHVTIKSWMRLATLFKEQHQHRNQNVLEQTFVHADVLAWAPSHERSLLVWTVKLLYFYQQTAPVVAKKPLGLGTPGLHALGEGWKPISASSGQGQQTK